MRQGAWVGLVLLLLLGGCAANVRKDAGAAPLTVGRESSKTIVLNIDGSKLASAAKDWEPFKGEWRTAMQAAASAAGANFSEQQGEAHPTGQPGTLVSIFVGDYRYISTGARYGPWHHDRQRIRRLPPRSSATSTVVAHSAKEPTTPRPLPGKVFSRR